MAAFPDLDVKDFTAGTARTMKGIDLGSSKASLGHVLIDSAMGEILGLKTDAANTFTNSTAIPVMSVLKQISLSVQTPPSRTYKWNAGATGGWASAFGSEINSLVSGNAILSTLSIDNSGNLDMFCDVSFSLGSITPSGSPYLGLYLYPLNQDGTTYGDGRFSSSAAGPPPQNYYCGFAGLPASVGVQTGMFDLPGRRSPIIIPPGIFKFVWYNASGVTLAGSSNTVKYRTYNRTNS